MIRVVDCMFGQANVSVNLYPFFDENLLQLLIKHFVEKNTHREIHHSVTYYQHPSHRHIILILSKRKNAIACHHSPSCHILRALLFWILCLTKKLFVYVDMTFRFLETRRICFPRIFSFYCVLCNN